MSEGFGETETVPGGTGGGVAQSAAGQDDRVRGEESSVSQFGAGDRPVFGLQAADITVQADPDIPFPQESCEGLGDIACFFGGGEDPPAALHGDRTSVFLHQGHHIPGRKKTQRTVEEPRIAGNLGEEFVQIAVVGQVTAAFACNIDFLSEFFVLFQQGHFSPCAGGKNSSHHAGCAATDDQYFSHD